MSLKSEPIGPVPTDTARVAKAAFPRGNPYLRLRDHLGTIYTDAAFAPLFAERGRPAETPWRLALITVMQFAEGLSDRQAAEAVRARIDWKYLLGLDLTDPGFDFSILCEFRARLIQQETTEHLLEALVAACKAQGVLKARGRQRTDATHVLAALRVLNRIERVGETMRAALNATAQVAPGWLQGWVPPEWYERYGRRIEDARLPKGQEARHQLALQIGQDGRRFLQQVDVESTPDTVQHVPEITLLRQVWDQQFVLTDGHVQWRPPDEQPPVGEQIESPYETEARYAVKRGQNWIGYKVHLTETCDADQPLLITDVQTTTANIHDVHQTPIVQAALARRDLVPAAHLVDMAYVSAEHLVSSQTKHSIRLIGPVYADRQWQAVAGNGFDVTHFQINWAEQRATCPQGKRSIRWGTTHTARRKRMISIGFALEDCLPCPMRSRCTRAKDQARSLLVQGEAEHVALQQRRAEQQTDAFLQLYHQRAGIEGTFSQGVRAFGLRFARYRGLAKTHLQDVATATAINVYRLSDWWSSRPRAKTRRSSFAALAPAS